VAGSVEHCDELAGSINGEHFLNHATECFLLKNSAPYNWFLGRVLQTGDRPITKDRPTTQDNRDIDLYHKLTEVSLTF
jgi:hypothetical protein